MPDLPDNPKPTKLAASTVAPQRFSSWRNHLAAERRWVADTFARDRMVDFFKQLAWVAPLTLLIWVYAEREQIDTFPNETIPFRLVLIDPNKTVELMPRQDSNLVLELQGPRARLQDVLQRLRGGTSLQGLRLEIDRSLAPQEHVLPTMALVASNPVFTQNGITVTRCQPERLHVLVDRIVDVEAKVVPPPGVTTLGPGTRFEPPTVKVRGPASLLNRAAQEAGGSVNLFVQIPDDLVRTAGEKDTRRLRLELPSVLRDDERVQLARQDVEATLQVREAEVEWRMDAMTVSLDVSNQVADRFKVNYQSSLPGVTLVGPKDVIEQLSGQGYDPKPYAQLRVTLADTTSGIGERRMRKLRFVDLPKDVRVHEKDLNREVTFTIEQRTDVE